MAGNVLRHGPRYCESLDHLPQITGLDGDLKNVQRPSAVKSILSQVPPPARVLEFGGGEPIVSFASRTRLRNDPGRSLRWIRSSPTAYESFLQQFPHVKIVREYFRPGLPDIVPQSFDAILSVSVLEHLEGDSLTKCFDAVAEFLRPGGSSVHCFDMILQGPGEAHDFVQAQRIFAEQNRVISDATKDRSQSWWNDCARMSKLFSCRRRVTINGAAGVPIPTFRFERSCRCEWPCGAD